MTTHLQDLYHTHELWLGYHYPRWPPTVFSELPLESLKWAFMLRTCPNNWNDDGGTKRTQYRAVVYIDSGVVETAGRQ